MNDIKIGDVIQFNERHKWCGCLGIVEEIKIHDDETSYMIGVLIPQEGTAYIYALNNEIEKIGKAIFK